MDRYDSLLLDFAPDIGQMVSAIVGSRSFQRLRKVSFLGAIDRLSNRSGGRTAPSSGSRFDHSLGVAEIMCSISGSMGLSPGELRLAVANALLHDLGHGPYSHSSEPFFSKAFGLNHHIALRSIIEDETSEVSQILKAFGLWLDYRRFVRAPASIPAVHRLYYGSINVDTIEGIIRSAQFFNIDTSLERSSLIQSLTRQHVAVRPLDSFWNLKSRVYNEHIFANQYAWYDEAFTCALDSMRDRIRSEHFYLDDDEFEAEMGERFESSLLRERERITVRGAPRVRTFEINRRVAARQFNALDRRYNEVKGGNESRSKHNS